MKRPLPGSILVLALVAAGSAQAQLSKGGEPLSWSLPDVNLARFVVTANTDPAARDAVLAEGRFGVQHAVDIDVVEQGDHRDMPEGGTLISLVIESPEAAALALQFDRWELPAGATVFLFDEGRTRIIGALDLDNRSPVGDMATALVPGDAVVVEYHVPAGQPLGELRVASLTHAFFDPVQRARQSAARDFDPGFSSAPCHFNLACPEAAAWQLEKRAVAMFIRPDGGGCTGTLINNVAQPGRPLFYAANHCFQPNTSQWVFYFNYEAPACVGNVGSTDQTLVGSTFLAADFISDFALVELFTAPPAAFQPYYAGWDRTGAVPQTGTVIHHPLYDVKKFTFDQDPATDYFDPNGIPLWRNFWDIGIVEAVSSGAALWDQNKRIVGHMTEGAQTCDNADVVNTGCAKFSAGWNGPIPTNRKRDHLDPSLSTPVLDGFDPYAAPTVLVRPRLFLEGPFDPATQRMRDDLRTLGLLPTNEPYSAQGFSLPGGGGEEVQSATFAQAGDNAIVDWVVVELRNASDASQVLAARCALIQRDGDVVDMDGSSPVLFSMPAGGYRLALRHRNHLGVVTASALALGAEVVQVDLTTGSVPLLGGTQATKALGGWQVLYAGDVNGDDVLRYTGEQNDRDLILQAIGGQVPTATAQGYRVEDVTLDGVVAYTGPANDRDLILQNIGGVVPTAIRVGPLP